VYEYFRFPKVKLTTQFSGTYLGIALVWSEVQGTFRRRWMGLCVGMKCSCQSYGLLIYHLGPAAKMSHSQQYKSSLVIYITGDAFMWRRLCSHMQYCVARACIVSLSSVCSLRPVCWLLSSWCSVCIRRVAHISANRDANGYRYGYGSGYGYGSQVCIYTGF